MAAAPWHSPLLVNVFVCIGIALCITQSAIFSDLNLATFSISKLRLEVEAAGATAMRLDYSRTSLGPFAVSSAICIFDRFGAYFVPQHGPDFHVLFGRQRNRRARLRLVPCHGKSRRRHAGVRRLRRFATPPCPAVSGREICLALAPHRTSSSSASARLAPASLSSNAARRRRCTAPDGAWLINDGISPKG